MLQVIALEACLKDCPYILHLGVKANFEDYSPSQRQMILDAPKIYFPSTLYAELFDTMGKATFPSYQTYKVAQDKIKQTALFKLLGIPHPPTRIFYGKRQKSRILEYFKLPLIAKVPRGSALGRGVSLISTVAQLEQYCSENQMAYIQAYLPIKKDLRVVVVGDQVLHAYWRVAPEGDYLCNVSAGGAIDLDGIPRAATDLALSVAKRCGWDNVGLDICCHDGRYYVLEGNMKYGKQGFVAAGLDFTDLISNLIAKRII